MQKIIQIDDKEVGFKANAGVFYNYKMQYHKDPLASLMRMATSDGGFNVDGFDMEMLFQLAHLMAKTYDPTIPDTVSGWIATFDDLPLSVVTTDIMELLVESMGATTESKKKNEMSVPKK